MSRLYPRQKGRRMMEIERKFKAKIVDDFHNVWLTNAAVDEGISLELAKHYYDDEKFKEFSDRISGNVVTIVEYSYVEGRTDYFEEIENDSPLPQHMFTEIE